MEINNFLKERQEKNENLKLKESIPSFLFKFDEIINELKNIEENELNELFSGVFTSLNQLGDKLFNNELNITLIEEFKFKIKNYNEKSYNVLLKINDLILSDLITNMEIEFKENGLKPFYDEKQKNRKIKQSTI